MSNDPAGDGHLPKPGPASPGGRQASPTRGRNAAPGPYDRRPWHDWAEALKRGAHRPDWWIHHTAALFR